MVGTIFYQIFFFLALLLIDFYALRPHELEEIKEKKKLGLGLPLYFPHFLFLNLLNYTT